MYVRFHNPSEQPVQCSELDCKLTTLVVVPTIVSAYISYNLIDEYACTAITLAIFTSLTVIACMISTHCGNDENKDTATGSTSRKKS
jgi:hypothetical protein